MKLPGWCTECRRVRPRVRVGGGNLALLGAGGPAVGVCDDCADRAEVRRFVAAHPRHVTRCECLAERGHRTSSCGCGCHNRGDGAP